jgi:hypothetical protein
LIAQPDAPVAGPILAVTFWSAGLTARSGVFDGYAFAARSVLPAQTEWVHLQSRSGISSIASHWGLQYFSEVT